MMIAARRCGAPILLNIFACISKSLHVSFHIYVRPVVSILVYTLLTLNMEETQPRKTVAVIGSGMAGLVTAYLLHHDPLQRYQVRLLEKVRLSRLIPGRH